MEAIEIAADAAAIPADMEDITITMGSTMNFPVLRGFLWSRARAYII